MRYCSQCGNPLSAGASFCHSCGAALKAVVPEADETPVAAPVTEEPEVVTPVAEGPVVETPAEEPVAETPAEEPVVEAPAAAPVVVDGNENEQIKEEREFLDATHRFLRWERKAWSITGKVFLIMGIVYAALFFLFGVLILAVDNGDEVGIAVGGAILFVYCIMFGGLFIANGIINIITAGKIPQYTDTLYKDFSIANKRCNSIGMIVFGYFFNSIALVFFVINFARMKCNKKLIARILARQGVK